MGYLLELNEKIEFAQQRIEEAAKEVEDRTAELEQLQAGAWFCDSCRKYYPKDLVTTSERTETHVETVYTDAGYGDDDEIAEVTRLFTYQHCPFCGNSVRSRDGIYLHEANRRTRR